MIIYYLNLFITYKTGFFQAEKYTDYPQSGEGLKINRRSNGGADGKNFFILQNGREVNPMI